LLSGLIRKAKPKIAVKKSFTVELAHSSVKHQSLNKQALKQ